MLEKKVTRAIICLNRTIINPDVNIRVFSSSRSSCCQLLLLLLPLGACLRRQFEVAHQRQRNSVVGTVPDFGIEDGDLSPCAVHCLAALAVFLQFGAHGPFVSENFAIVLCSKLVLKSSSSASLTAVQLHPPSTTVFL